MRTERVPEESRQCKSKPELQTLIHVSGGLEWMNGCVSWMINPIFIQLQNNHIHLESCESEIIWRIWAANVQVWFHTPIKEVIIVKTCPYRLVGWLMIHLNLSSLALYMFSISI